MKAIRIQKTAWSLVLGLLVALSCPAQEEEPATFESLLVELKKKPVGLDMYGGKYARYNSAKQLGEMKDPRAVEPLIETLQDNDSDLRAECARALGKIGDPRAVEPLQALAEKDRSERTRFAAVVGLHGLGQPVLQDLIAYLKGGEAEAATILGNDKNRSAIGALIEALDCDDWNVKLEAIKALGTMGAREAVPTLMGMVARGPTDYETDGLGKEAALVLGQIGDRRAVDQLLEALASQSIQTQTRDGAIEALGMLRDQKAVEPLIKAIWTDNDWPRVDVATSLAQIGGNRATAVLLEEFRKCESSKHLTFKDGLQAALRDISDPDAMPAFVKALDDSDPDLCCLAAGVLGRSGDPRGIKAMVAILGSSDPEVKGTAINSLPGMGSGAVPELLALLKNPGTEAETRSWAVVVLGDIGDQGTAEDLLPLLSDKDSYVRLAAFEALGKIGSPDSVAELSRQLRHPDARIRRAAGTALGQIGDPSAIPALTKTAGDPDDLVRSVALSALAATDDARVVKTLADATKTEKEEVLASAAAGLATIGSEESLSLLNGMMSGENELLKADVIFALAESDSDAAAIFLEDAARTNLEFVGNLARVSLVKKQIESPKPTVVPTEPDPAGSDETGDVTVPDKVGTDTADDVNVAETDTNNIAVDLVKNDTAGQLLLHSDDDPTKNVEGTLFEEDFDDGTAKGFGNEAGNWKVVNGKYAPSLPVSTKAGEILVEEDFTSGAVNWQLEDKNASINDGKLYWDTGHHLSAILQQNIPMENVIIEFDGQVDSNGINVYLHNENDEGYVVVLGGWHNTKSGSEVGKLGENRVLVRSKVWEPGRWHHYKVIRQGDDLKAFVDGHTIFERTVTSRYPGTWKLKFNSWKARIGIDNIKIYRLPAPGGKSYPPGALFEEDFNDGTAEGFGNEAGNWEVVDGRYTPSAPIITSPIDADSISGVRHSSFGEQDWKYHILEADFMNAYNGGMIIRGQDNFGDGGLVLSIVPGDDIYLPNGFINLQDGWGGAPIAGTELGFKGGEDLHIKVESFGETGEQGGEIIKVYVNDELKITTEWLCSVGRSDQGKVYLYLNQYFDEQSAAETMGFTAEEIETEKKHLAGQSWDNIIVRKKESISSTPVKFEEPAPTATFPIVIILPTPTPEPPPVIREKNISISEIEQREKTISVKLTGKGLSQGVVVQGELNSSYDNRTIQRGASIVIDDGSASLHFRAPYMGWPPGQYTVTIRVGSELKATRNVDIKRSKRRTR